MTAPTDDDFAFFAPSAPEVAGPDVAAPPPMVQGRMGFAPSPALYPSEPQPKPSRWAKSDTTFGPIGRVISTIALIVPFILLVAAGVFTFDPFVLGGAGIWAALMVMGLRQVWQLVHHHHRR